jgi:hypothetical protein
MILLLVVGGAELVRLQSLVISVKRGIFGNMLPALD